MSSGSEESGDDDTFRILIVTDTHIGYLERDPIRGNDSFLTWEEVLKQARHLKVDFILHGGDLFHDNKPSRRTMFRTMELIRQYCFGDAEIKIQIVSDQAVNFPNFKTVNFADPNFNIATPIFVIHGNHDDPAGDGQFSAIDLLSVSNMVNYFGKSNNIDDITLYPVLLTKGTTKVALYGLGNIRDERLHRTWAQKKVRFMRPMEGRSEWFNLFVIHQNRIMHNSPKNYISESLLDNFLDFVLWGHEHECNIVPTPSSEGEFYVSQPGSTIATSLSEGEAKQKHIGLLEIHGNQFRLRPIKLKTVRPYYIEDIIMSQEATHVDPNDVEQVTLFLRGKVEEILKRESDAVKGAEGKDKDSIDLQPLIRLRVEYTGFVSVNPTRFGQHFVGRVANPNEILNFIRRKTTKTKGAPLTKEQEKDFLKQVTRPDPLDDISIEDLIEALAMSLLIEKEFNRALHLFVEKEEKNALDEFVQAQISSTQKHVNSILKNEQHNQEEIKSLIADHVQQRRQQVELEEKEYEEQEGRKKRKKAAKDIDEDFADSLLNAFNTPSLTPASTKSTATTNPRSTAAQAKVKKEPASQTAPKDNKRKRGNSMTIVIDSDDEKEEKEKEKGKAKGKEKKVSIKHEPFPTEKKSTQKFSSDDENVEEPAKKKQKLNPNMTSNLNTSASSGSGSILSFLLNSGKKEKEKEKPGTINTSKWGTRKK